jgi:hypothetical protein
MIILTFNPEVIEAFIVRLNKWVVTFHTRR